MSWIHFFHDNRQITCELVILFIDKLIIFVINIRSVSTVDFKILSDASPMEVVLEPFVVWISFLTWFLWRIDKITFQQSQIFAKFCGNFGIFSIFWDCFKTFSVFWHLMESIDELLSFFYLRNLLRWRKRCLLQWLPLFLL